MSLINTDINTNTCKCHLAIDNINIIAIIRSQYQYIVIDRHYCSALVHRYLFYFCSVLTFWDSILAKSKSQVVFNTESLLLNFMHDVLGQSLDDGLIVINLLSAVRKSHLRWALNEGLDGCVTTSHAQPLHTNNFSGLFT